jgi:hypothetical protein
MIACRAHCVVCPTSTIEERASRFTNQKQDRSFVFENVISTSFIFTNIAAFAIRIHEALHALFCPIGRQTIFIRFDQQASTKLFGADSHQLD